MTITVTQPDTQFAASCVRVYIDGKSIGTIGPGETVFGQSNVEPNYPFEVKVECGSYYATFHNHNDVRLNVVWSVTPPAMRLEKER